MRGNDGVGRDAAFQPLLERGAPAVILQQLSPTPPELCEVRIGGVENRSKRRFAFAERLVASRIRELKCLPVPVGGREHAISWSASLRPSYCRSAARGARIARPGLAAV